MISDTYNPDVIVDVIISCSTGSQWSPSIKPCTRRLHTVVIMPPLIITIVILEHGLFEWLVGVSLA